MSTQQLDSNNVQGTILDDMMRRVREVNEANGWFEDDRRFGEDIALLHSEVSEALEEYREHGTVACIKGVAIDDSGFIEVTDQQYAGNKPLGVPSEMADILIRLLDTCDRYNIDISAEFDAKLSYNATRGHKHGGKAL